MPGTQQPRPRAGPGDTAAGGGQAQPASVSELVSRYDWARTPLGPMEQWPASLRTVVRVLLGSRFSMWMAWGPELTMLYNDTYRHDTLRAKHPWALGRPAREVWAEIWDDIYPRIRSVLDTGEATWDENLLLFLERSGYPEETYHTFSYSPLPGDNGEIAGMLCVVTEETERVISERRMTTLRELASALGGTQTRDQVVTQARQELTANPFDLPFSLLYLFDEDGSARLAASTGIEPGTPGAPDLVAPGESGGWPLEELRHGRAEVVGELAARFGALPTGPWARPPGEALAVPLAAGQGQVAGALIVGTNPHRRLEQQYRGFVELVANQIASGLLSAGAYEAERARAEALAELDRAKTEFFTGVSHELRTPLTLIGGPVDDLLEARDPPLATADRERLELVRRNTGRLRRLVDTLLDFGQLEEGQLRPHPRPVDVVELTRALAESFVPAARRAGLTMTIDCPDGEHQVLIDPDIWEKITLNLLSNAVKFTPQGSVTVSLAVESGDPTGRLEDTGADRRTLRLRVSDTGVGIPADQLPLLFQRFHRAHGGGARSFEGTGIGLALVAELTELLGGTASVTSEVGAGSAFTVTVPVPAAPDRLADRALVTTTSGTARRYVDEALQWSAARPSPEPAGDRGRARTVLVAEDNADMRRYLADLLTPHYRVLLATDGREAVERVRADAPDLVLSDVMMPGLDGFELLAAIRADPGTATIPVIMLSARAGEESAIEGLAAGADDYLPKPFSSAALLARVHATLELARARTGQSRQLSELARATIAINDALTTRQALDTLATAARELIGAHQAVVSVRLGQGYAQPSTATSFSAKYARWSGFDVSPDDSGLAALVCRENRPMRLTQAELESHPAWRGARDLADRHPPLRGWLAAPLAAGDGRNLGLVRLSDRYEGEFTADDEAILTQLAEIGSAVVEKAQLLSEQTEVALTLQRSILGPTHLPAGFAVRYEPAAGTLEVGGDWYDVIDLSDGRYGVVVGDVVGRGLAAASVMGQLRSATRALLLENNSPGQVLAALDTFSALIPDARCSTVFCAILEPATASVSYSCAGHPPAILLDADGGHQLLEQARGVPLAVHGQTARPEAVARLSPGATLLLYTDGLVERRGESLDTGIDRAVGALRDGRHRSVEELAKDLAASLLAEGHDDDVAFLIYRQPSIGTFHYALPGRPSALAGLRQALRGWLDAQDVSAWVGEDLLVVVSEAATNAMEHGYRLDERQVVDIEAVRTVDRIELTVRDSGRPGSGAPPREPDRHRGRGLLIMRALTDEFDIDITSEGTEVRMIRRTDP